MIMITFDDGSKYTLRDNETYTLESFGLKIIDYGRNIETIYPWHRIQNIFID